MMNSGRVVGSYEELASWIGCDTRLHGWIDGKRGRDD